LRAAVEHGTLILEVTDDGRGIDWEQVAELAAARGLPHRRHADLVRALLSDGFTTRDSATLTSGRGVGLSALRRRVEAMGGVIDVQSVRGSGTRWALRFPCIEPDARGASRPRVRAEGRTYAIRSAA
jgi:two-component system chemotaxis sensor kinase CheA